MSLFASEILLKQSSQEECFYEFFNSLQNGHRNTLVNGRVLFTNKKVVTGKELES